MFFYTKELDIKKIVLSLVPLMLMSATVLHAAGLSAVEIDSSIGASAAGDRSIAIGSFASSKKENSIALGYNFQGRFLKDSPKRIRVIDTYDSY